MRALKRDENVHDAIQLAIQKSTQASLALLTGGQHSTLMAAWWVACIETGKHGGTVDTPVRISPDRVMRHQQVRL
jgi:hypothetical protein